MTTEEAPPPPNFAYASWAWDGSGLKYLRSSIDDEATTHVVIAPAVEDLSSPFSQAQCGNWDGVDGYISGRDLNDGTIRHEAGNQNSHWEKYRNAQDDAANNLGTVAERQVGSTSLTLPQFVNSVKAALNARASAISGAYALEPCAPNYDSTCATYRGKVNTLILINVLEIGSKGSHGAIPYSHASAQRSGHRTAIRCRPRA